jgi:branched-chain amino acid aminotransferase
MALAVIDGVEHPLDEARIPVRDRAFLYGDAVFEALRTHRGRPDALDRHLERLERSAAVLGIRMPVSREVLAREVEQAVAHVAADRGSAGGFAGERYIRIIITRGDTPEALPPAGAGQARRVILVRPLELPGAQSLARGLCMISQQVVPSPLWAGAKPTAYLSNLLAVGAARAQGADDALLVGAHGELLEGATSSVFVVRRGELLTPPLSLGILPGITRERVLACAERAGLAPRESLLTIHDAYRADELLATSSVRGVVGVVRLDGLCIGSGQPGPVSEALRQAYEAELELP